ncbi:MAG: HEPN domain-containing protein [Deltaproteobacteria bacterium]|nr:HEPN domain-containing protein [Deltaproteobacteria bacterium]
MTQITQKFSGYGDYECSCFAAQQSAEKAVRALYQYLGGDTSGHSISKVLKELPKMVQPDKSLFKKAADLRQAVYIPTKYPNGFDWGSPAG